MNQHSTVLIVGAGPCGLMAACELWRSPLENEAKALAASQSALLTHRHRTDRETGFVLLRPDGFVAACGRPADLIHAAHALNALKG